MKEDMEDDKEMRRYCKLEEALKSKLLNSFLK
jgi:hypothetical protein